MTVKSNGTGGCKRRKFDKNVRYRCNGYIAPTHIIDDDKIIL